MIKEQQVSDILKKILNTSCNWSLILITAVLFYIMCYTSFSTNYGYDRVTSWYNIVILFSGLSLIARYIKNDTTIKDMVGEYGVLSFILSLVTLLLLKTVLGETLRYFINFVLCPLSIFVFLLLVKHVYISKK